MGKAEKIKGLLVKPTQKHLAFTFDNMSFLDSTAYYMISCVDENFFSFLSGIVVSFPVTILFNMTSYKIESSGDWWVFALNILLLINTCLLSYHSIAFTMAHIFINKLTSSIDNIEISTNIMAEAIFAKIKTMSSHIVRFGLNLIVFVILIIVIIFYNTGQ